MSFFSVIGVLVCLFLTAIVLTEFGVFSLIGGLVEFLLMCVVGIVAGVATAVVELGGALRSTAAFLLGNFPLMMRLFNAIQLVALFAVAPLGLNWLYHATFQGAVFAFWAATACYAGLGGMIVAAVHNNLESERKGSARL